jgi:hypothetical protein
MITPHISMKVRQLAAQFRYSIVALVLVSVCSMRALAQDDHSHTMAQQDQETTTDQQSVLLKVVRNATARFKDVSETANTHRSYSTKSSGQKHCFPSRHRSLPATALRDCHQPTG